MSRRESARQQRHCAETLGMRPFLGMGSTLRVQCGWREAGGEQGGHGLG